MIQQTNPMMRPEELCEAIGWPTDLGIRHGCQVQEVSPLGVADDIVRVMLAMGLASIGLQVGLPKTRKAFEKLLGPPPAGSKWDLDRKFSLKEKTGISTCAMVALGWARAAGVWASDYIPGEGTTRIESEARLAGAWGRPADGDRPPAGALVVFGEGNSTHVDMCLIRPDAEYFSVDGGQVGASGLQAIFGRRRKFVQDGPRQLIGDRVVHGWVDPCLMPIVPHAVILAPVGWRRIPV